MAQIVVNGVLVNVANVKNGKSHSWESWNIYGLHDVPLCNYATIGAGLTGSTISAAVILPQFCKIPKVAVGYKSVDLFNGTETFNIVVESAGDASTTNTGVKPGTPAGPSAGFQASYTAGGLQGVGYIDNSQLYGYPNQLGPGSPPNNDFAGPTFFPVGSCLFANDVPFDAATFTSAASSGGGGVVLATTNYDGVFAAGTILSLRAVTTASTGSITGLCITLLVENIDEYISDDWSVPLQNW